MCAYQTGNHGKRNRLRAEILERRDMLAASIAADFNADGIVDGRDYAAYRESLGAQIALPNEVSTYGEVTSEDLEDWNANYGRSTPAPRVMEDLDRGVIAVRTGETQALVSWRLLGLDDPGIEFNVYRSQNGGASWIKRNGAPLDGGTNYLDTGVSLLDTVDTSYRVNPVLNGVELPSDGQWTMTAGDWAPTRTNNVQPALRVPLPTPEGYRIHVIWPGDLDGDGQYELVASMGGLSESLEHKVMAFELDGTLLWEVDMGPNSIDTGQGRYSLATELVAGQMDGVTVHDFDGDGKAEIALKTGDGVTLGDGSMITSESHLDQFLSILDGETGTELARTDLPNPFRERTGHVLVTLFGVGYLDGQTPSLMIHGKAREGGSGTPFNTINSAWEFRDGEIHQQWSIHRNGYDSDNFTSSHQMRILDIDADGRDEMVVGMHAIDHDGTLLWDLWSVGINHGDRFHIGDLDPNRPGLEMYGVQQFNALGITEYFGDPADGTLLWTINVAPPGYDSGRGVVADLHAGRDGYEVWAFEGIHTATGEQLTEDPNRPWPNLQIWWDGDLLGEVMNESMIDKWVLEDDPSSPYSSISAQRLLTGWRDGAHVDGSTRNTPSFYGDILGDWREEVIFSNYDASELLIYTTPYQSEHRIYTLAHNPAYRNQFTVKGYVQQNIPDYYLGHGMSDPPTPNITYTRNNSSDISDSLPLFAPIPLEEMLSVPVADPASTQRLEFSKTATDHSGSSLEIGSDQQELLFLHGTAQRRSAITEENLIETKTEQSNSTLEIVRSIDFDAMETAFASWI